MNSVFERPGASTPWKTINELLTPDECFEIRTTEKQGYLFAPKETSRLVALLYLLSEENLSFNVQGRGTTIYRKKAPSLIISSRAFSQIFLHAYDVVEIGAGCTLSDLHQFLYERKQEVNLQGAFMTSSKRSVGGVLLCGETASIQLKQECMIESLLGVELVSWEGSQLQWGGKLRSSSAGPALHKLLWGIGCFPGVLTKIILKTYPIPPVRLHLVWAFKQKESLWECFYALKNFSSSWERLDCILSGQAADQGFIWAQISGLEEEMEAFQQICPYYQIAQKKDSTIVALKNFLFQKKLNAYCTSLEQFLEEGEYLWYQGLDCRAWWLTPEIIENNSDQSQPIWKQYFFKSLFQPTNI